MCSLALDNLRERVYSYHEVAEDFKTFCQASGIRTSQLTDALDEFLAHPEGSPGLCCVACSTPPQEGKTTYIVHLLAWKLIRNPWLSVVYATYNQARANAISRQVRTLVQRWTPLKQGSVGVQRWQTREGGGLLAAGRESSMTGFRSDLTVIDDPVKDLKEAHSREIRRSVLSWFESVVLTRVSVSCQIIVICTRWHKADLIAHLTEELGVAYLNVPAQSVAEDDPLGRKPGQWLQSVQGRSEQSWETTKRMVGGYVWQALYQGDPVADGGTYIHTSNLGIIEAAEVVQRGPNGAMYTLGTALVIQSWDLAFTGDGDYVAGHVWANIGGTHVLLDRVHEKLDFTQTVNAVLRMSARWPQTAQVLIEKAANGAALVSALRRRVHGLKAVTPLGSKQVRALACQPLIDQGSVKLVSEVIDPSFLDELEAFPSGKHDDDVDAMTQYLLHSNADYFRVQ